MISKCLLKKTARSFFVIMLLLGSFMSNELRAQGATTVSGVVLDETGLPIPGANVVEKGTKNSASTDFDGKYSIKVTSSKSVLVFSYIGYEDQPQTVGSKKTLNVSLKSKASQLNEVVVVGYGTTKKSDLTGAVSTISGADLKKVAVANIAESLTGRVAGVQVSSSEGSPDSDIKIRVRGSGSVTGDSSPLIIVDGFPVNSMNDVSPADVESMTILKDASSTAIYGSRGAYGVIIITTKSGKDNKISVSYNMFMGIKNIAKKIDVLKPYDYAKWQYEYAMLKNTGNTASYDVYFDPYQTYAGQEGIDWQDEIYGRTGEVQSHDLGIRGGSDKLSYSFTYSLFDDKAIQIGSDYKRNNISFNLKNKVSDKVDLSFTMRYSNTKIGGSGANDQKEFSSNDSRYRNVVAYSPIDIPELTTSDTDETVAGYLTNPFTSIADNDRDQLRTNYNMLGNFSWKIIKNLQFKSDFGLDYLNNTDYRFYGRSTYYVNNVPGTESKKLPAMIMTDQKNKRFRNANTINYDFKGLIKNENHNLKLLLGEEMITTSSNAVTSTLHGYPSLFTFEQAKTLTSQAKDPLSVDNYYFPDDNLLSFFGRVNYDYKNRYLLTGTFRADGSSKFLGDNVWGYFPSVAAAWKINEESFLKDVSWINALKLRVSYGEAGNNNIPVGQTVQNYMSTATTWINGITNFWAPSKTQANPDLKWETTVTQNIGLDYDFFKGRLSGSFDVYKNITKDLLILFPVSGAGYDNQYRNMGENQNTGFEASINVAAIQKEDYGLSFSFNMGMNKNKINSLGVMDDYTVSSGALGSLVANDFYVTKGQPIGQIRGYKNAGRYEVSDFNYLAGVYTLKPGLVNSGAITGTGGTGNLQQPGDMKLVDINGDKKVDVNDLTVIGNTNPKSTGGFVINGNVYGFDLMAAFNYSYGNDVYNANKVEFNTAAGNPNGQYRNLSTDMADGKRWTSLDPLTGALATDPARLQELNANTTMWSPNAPRLVLTDWAVEDGSFLRLNTFTLGYTLPERIVSKLGISKLRFYQTMSNVFVITNYSGPDPEANTRRQLPTTPGVDFAAYPRNRQVVWGLNLSF